MFMGLSCLHLSFLLLALLVTAWPAGRICARTGHSPWLGILALVPGVNLILLWYIAFASWPAVDGRRVS